MIEEARRTAIVVGASSGIGEALARQLTAEGWRVCLMARRLSRLEAIAETLSRDALARHIDLSDAETAAATLTAVIDELGGADLVVMSSGTGYPNTALDWPPDRETLAVNVVGFAAVAQAAMRHFIARGRGHLVGITSIAALRGFAPTAAYAGSKALQSLYLESLRDLARLRRLPIAVTEAQPGFVATAMMQSERVFWVASAAVAAQQIMRAIRRRRKHAYITRRWAIIALLLRCLPRPG
ncbi:MAG TPA: SDR family NAD(P)-dependent oxidoreductase [Stellaceae bacterium]|nr:SDR family NAD(P)-dependent oxidoreductase [Stellaceae bacterium]